MVLVSVCVGVGVSGFSECVCGRGYVGGFSE